MVIFNHRSPREIGECHEVHVRARIPRPHNLRPSECYAAATSCTLYGLSEYDVRSIRHYAASLRSIVSAVHCAGGANSSPVEYSYIQVISRRNLRLTGRSQRMYAGPPMAGIGLTMGGGSTPTAPVGRAFTYNRIRTISLIKDQ